MAETIEQYADRIVTKVRREVMSQLDDDVIGSISKTHIIFAKGCVIEAMANAMREAAEMKKGLGHD